MFENLLILFKKSFTHIKILQIMKSVYCKPEDQFKGNTGLKQVKEKLCKKIVQKKCVKS